MDDSSDSLEDPLFGHLQWDAETSWWDGYFPATAGERFTLSVQPNSPFDRTISYAARSSFTQRQGDLEGIRQHALQEFFSQSGGAIGDEHFTLEQLLTHLRPGTIMVRSDGYFEVSFEDRAERVIGGGHIIVSRFWPSGTREVVFEG